MEGRLVRWAFVVYMGWNGLLQDSELLELRQTIELLRKQSVEAGLTSAHLQSVSPAMMRRHTVTDGKQRPTSCTSIAEAHSHS